MALRPATHRALGARATQILLDLVDDVTQVLLALRGALGDEAVDLLVNLRVQGLKRQLLEFPLDHVHAEAVGQRRVNLQGLLGLLRGRLGGHETPRAGVMDTVAQLDEQHADVTAHRDEHLTQGLGLSGGTVAHLVELGHAVDQIRNRFSEVRGEFFQGVVGILDRVVKQRGDQRRRRHTHLSENGGDRYRVRDIRFTGLAHLPPVTFFGLAVGALNDTDVGLGMIGAQSPHKRLNLGNCGASARTEPHEAGAHSGHGRRQCGP